MNERTQIDWSRVVPGKTWLESPNGCQCRVDAVMGEDVWVYYRNGKNSPALHLSWTKSSIESCKWQIREEWKDVTGECSFHWVVGSDGPLASIWHGCHPITPTLNYKLEGRRIYKRRTL